ncbi:MAG: membrane integrity-associated transporter subunit PqiC [Gammaproteobacteria bacterium]
MIRPLLLMLALVTAAGCARTPPAQYYLIHAPDATTVGKADGPRIGLGPVRLPSYLDRPQIVSWASATRLRLSNAHRWAEPLQQSVSRALLAQLAQALPDAQIVPWPWRGAQSPPRRIAVDVQRFERAADGTLHLDARWTVQAADGGAPQAFDSAIALPVTGAADDYDAIVAAASDAVGALAQDIARRLPSAP